LLTHLVGMFHPLVVDIYLKCIRVSFNVGLNDPREAVRVVFVFNLQAVTHLQVWLQLESSWFLVCNHNLSHLEHLRVYFRIVVKELLC